MKNAAEIMEAFKNRLSPKRNKIHTLEYLKRQELQQEISELLNEINVVQKQFDNELDFDLIEAHIWELHALEVRYRKALQQVKATF